MWNAIFWLVMGGLIMYARSLRLANKALVNEVVRTTIEANGLRGLLATQAKMLGFRDALLDDAASALQFARRSIEELKHAGYEEPAIIEHDERAIG